MTNIYSMPATAAGWSRTIPTGGVPQDDYLVVEAMPPQYQIYTFLYPSRPFDQGNLMFPLPVMVGNELTMAGASGGVGVDLNLAQLLIDVVDCNGSPVQGATVSLPVGVMGTVRYTMMGTPITNGTSTDASGTAWIFNATPGNLDIYAQTSVGNLRTQHINAPARVGAFEAWTVVAIQP
jgi:hypothetical protein